MNDFDRLMNDSLKTAADGFRAQDVGIAQREFLARRKRRFVLQLAGGVALAGAAVAALLFATAAPKAVDDAIPPAGGLRVVETLAVGDEPLGISAGAKVWVANQGDSTVTVIDPGTGSVDTVPVPAASEIAVGGANAWVGGEDARFARVDVESYEVLRGRAGSASSIEDIAVGGTPEGAAWMVMSDGCVYEATTPALVPDDCVFPEGFNPTDVATDNDETWLLEQDSGRLWRLFPPLEEGDPLGAEFIDNPAGPYGDLLNDLDGGLWVSGSGGRIVRIDLDTGERTGVAVDGDYADLAFGPGYVWALAGVEGGETAKLYRLDGETGAPLEAPLELKGKPSDVTAFDGEAWVTLRERDEVVRVSVGRAEPLPEPVEPSPDETPSPDRGEEDGSALGQDVVMVFAKDGDIWAALADGTITRLTDTRATESDVTLLDNIFSKRAPAILFDRQGRDEPSRLFYIDLATMEQYPITDGWVPTVASGTAGPAAWLGNSASIPWVVIAELFAEPTREITIEGADGEPVQLSQLAWDAAGRFLYGLTNEPSPRVVSVDSTGELGELYSPAEAEVHYLAIAMGDRMDTVSVVRACCSATLVQGAALTSIEIGVLSGWGTGAGGTTFEPLVDISELPLEGDPRDFRLTRADGLSALVNEDGTVTWGPSDASGWIVSDGVRAFLVYGDNGDVQELPFEVHGGMDVNESRDLSGAR